MHLRGTLRFAVRLAGVTATVAVALAALGLALLLVGPRAVGVRPLIVLTGSMEPTLRVGGLAFMRPLADGTALEGEPAVDAAWAPTAAIRAGDVITFRSPRNPRQTISHRVTAVIEDEQGRRFATKGDNSPRPDVLPVPAEHVVGTVVFHVPYLGWAADWLRHGNAFLGLVGVPTVVVVVSESTKIAHDVRQRRRSSHATRAERHESFRRLART